MGMSVRAPVVAVCVASVLLGPAAAPHPAAPEPAYAAACPAWGAVQTGAAIAEPSINEASGLVESGDHPGVLWMIEDSLNPATVWGINEQGQTVAEIRLSGATNVDWEDISIDRLPGTDEIYVPDIGDNKNNRDGNARPLPVIYRLPEPDVSASGPKLTATVTPEAFPIRYADESGNLLPPRNAESFMVDPVTHDAFIPDKIVHLVGSQKQSWVFRLPATLTPGTVNLAIRVAAVNATKPIAADISADGQRIMIKQGSTALLWPRSGTVEATLDASASAPCRAKVGVGESLAQAPDGLWTTPDGTAPKLYRTPEN
jgi:hypothetical protein